MSSNDDIRSSSRKRNLTPKASELIQQQKTRRNNASNRSIQHQTSLSNICTSVPSNSVSNRRILKEIYCRGCKKKFNNFSSNQDFITKHAKKKRNV